MKRYRIFVVALLAMLILSSCGSMEESAEVAPTAVIEAQQEDGAELPVETAPIVPVEEEAVVVAQVEEPEPICYDIIPESFAFALDISINPSLRLFFDEEKVIVGVSFLNQDAIDVYASEKFVGQSMEDGIAKVVAVAEEQGFFDEDKDIEIELSQLTDVTLDGKILVEAKQYVEDYFGSQKEDAGVEQQMQTQPSEVQQATEQDVTAAIVNVAIKVSETVTEETGMMSPELCPTCNGMGASCSECGGTSIVHCKRCNGGYETCGVCGGNGKDPTDGKACSQCKGAGGFSCSWCGGALQHICPICWGDNTCKTCGGSGYVVASVE